MASLDCNNNFGVLLSKIFFLGHSYELDAFLLDIDQENILQWSFNKPEIFFLKYHDDKLIFCGKNYNIEFSIYQDKFLFTGFLVNQ